MHSGPNLWIVLAVAAAVVFAAGVWAGRWNARRERLSRRLRIYTVMQAFSTIEPEEVWRTRIAFVGEESGGHLVATVRLLGSQGAKVVDTENPATAGSARQVAVSFSRPRERVDESTEAEVLLYPKPGARAVRIRVEARRAGEPRLLTARNFVVAQPVN